MTQPVHKSVWTMWKSRLTRAKKKGPEAVVKVVEGFLGYCEDHNQWPDWWVMFKVAGEDALLDLRDRDGS